jgi:hypothetical protein
VSQPSQAAAFSYPNQRPIRPLLSREHRNRVFVAGALSNTVLTAGLTIVSLAGILLFIGSGSVSGEDASEIGVVLGVSIVVTVVGFLVYAAVGSVVRWWMAHALRRAA